MLPLQADARIRAFVLEALPAVTMRRPRDAHVLSGERFFEMTDELRMAQYLRSPVQSYCPFRLTHKTVSFGDPFDVVLPMVTLTDDGIVVAVCDLTHVASVH